MNHPTSCTSSSALARCQSELERLEQIQRRRYLEPEGGIDFTSNDFLAFSTAEPIRNIIRQGIEDRVPVGSGGSRLLRGNKSQHEQLEQQAAEFFGSEKALFFSTGFVANLALLTCLPQRDDLIVYDALAHASARMGIQASFAKSVKYRHNDLESLKKIIGNWRKTNSSKTPWIYVESLYSMDGDTTDLHEIFQIADRFGAMVIVDEAHATGVWGDSGGGFTEMFARRSNLISLHTCGKALGVSGGLVCAAASVIDYLISKSAPFIYSTAPSPLIALAVSEAIKLLQNSRYPRLALHENIKFANNKIRTTLNMEGSNSQIIPVIIGEDSTALKIAEQMQLAGFDIRAIRPPTVPTGTARLRLSITLHVDQAQIDRMFDHLKFVLENNLP